MDTNPHARPLVRVGTIADAASAAALHSSQIGEGFLSFLGPRFLTRLYGRVTREADSFLLVVADDSGVFGFIAGTSDVSALYRSFLRHDGIKAAISSAPRLIRSVPRAIETLRHGTGEGGRGGELLSIAVHPGHRGKGAGLALVSGFLAQLSEKGCRSAHVVVAATNAKAIGLYERAGFHTISEFELHPGTSSLVMEWSSTETDS
jgi:ribosomal protein S18 acetylase RimI-like enzyme